MILKSRKKFAAKILPTKVFCDNSIIYDSNNCLPAHQFLNHQAFDPAFIKNSLHFYSSNLSQWINHRTSFGIVYQHSFKTENSSSQSETFNFLNENYINQGISLILFCQKHETLNIQQKLTRTRYHWYRKLSKSPLDSGFQTNLNEKENIFNISYRAKHIPSISKNEFNLDHIILDHSLYRNSDIELRKDVDIIVCKSYLKNCLLAFLDDSFAVSKDKIVLKLNPLLVPFKIALTVEASTQKIKRKLYEVAEYLIDLLQEHTEMNMFPFVPDNLICVHQCDMLAVKYCIILKDETLKNGVLYLRNRDTLLSEMVHISNLLKTLLFYLQPEKLITYES